MYVHMRPYRILPSKTSCPSLPARPRKAGRTFEADRCSIIVLACLLRKYLSRMLVAFSVSRDSTRSRGAGREKSGASCVVSSLHASVHDVGAETDVIWEMHLP